jgi:hypothetical protein
MTKIEALIEEARRLSAEDRLRLLAEVERSLAGEPAAAASYAPLLALRGTARSGFSDVSTDKYSHVASALASEPADE